MQFDLDSYNLGVRYRYTFSRSGFVHYVFAGISWADGSAGSPATGALDYSGFTACLGPGASVALGKQFQLSAEAFGSFGIAHWENEPFASSSGTEFNPSMAGGTVNLSFLWGWEP